MIFNIVFGIWIFLLFGTMTTLAKEKEDVSEVRALSYIVMIGICLTVLTIMAIISKFS